MGIFNRLFGKKTKDKNAVKDNELLLPSWFHVEVLNKDIFEGKPTALAQLLNSSRQDVYSALSLYQVPVRYTTTLLISLVAVTGGLLSIIGRIGVDQNVIRNLEIGAGILLIVGGLIGFISVFVITQYYRVYVSALLYATQIHYAVDMASFHWFKRLLKFLSKVSKKRRDKQKPEISKDKFICARTRSWKDSNFWYAAFLIALSIISTTFGSIILIFAPFSKGLG